MDESREEREELERDVSDDEAEAREQDAAEYVWAAQREAIDW